MIRTSCIEGISFYDISYDINYKYLKVHQIIYMQNLYFVQ